MTSVLGVSVPKVNVAKADDAPAAAPKAEPKKSSLFSTKNIALGGLATTFLVGGGIIGKMKGNPLLGLGIGGALAAATVGAALLGNASSSRRDGYCDYYGDADCDYPGVDPYYPRNDPYYPPDYNYPTPDYDYPRNDYPSGGYPGGTSPGDDF